MEHFEFIKDMEIRTAKLESRMDYMEKFQSNLYIKLDKLEHKINRFNWWLVLTLGGVSASLILLLYNMMSRIQQ